MPNIPSVVDIQKLPRASHTLLRSRKRKLPIRGAPYSFVAPQVVEPEQQPEIITISAPTEVIVVGSQINPEWPVYGNPTTQSVRDNFSHAKAEIEALQAAQGSGIGNDAPTDGKSYGRNTNSWIQVIASSGDVVDGGNF